MNSRFAAILFHVPNGIKLLYLFFRHRLEIDALTAGEERRRGVNMIQDAGYVYVSHENHSKS